MDENKFGKNNDYNGNNTDNFEEIEINDANQEPFIEKNISSEENVNDNSENKNIEYNDVNYSTINDNINYNDNKDDDNSKGLHKSIPKKMNIFRLVALLITTSVLTSFVVGGGLYYKFYTDLKEQNEILENLTGFESSSDGSTATKTSVVTDSDSSQVSQIVENVGASIVGIKMTVSTSSNNFGNFFDQSENNSQSAESIGSGIVINKNGYILTNYHVISYADPNAQSQYSTVMEVYLDDETSYEAEFIGGDEDSDLAVIKIDAEKKDLDLTVATLGDSTQLNVGDPVIAIGNPLGLEFAGTVTTGIVSALDRSVESGNVSQNLIQTDAAINSGNSGGALINYSGEVIGINSMKIAVTGVEGIGFAIPTSEAKPIADQLIKYGKITDKPMIGISGQDITEEIAAANDLEVGVYISSVEDGSAANEAGLKKGDIIVGLAGEELTTMAEINSIKNQYSAGDTTDITIIRDGKEKTFDITFKASE
jgi:serine protease Do